MICEFGDVAVVPFPFVDKVVAKVRPALVISKASFNEENGQTLLAMITSARRSQWPSDIAIGDGAAAGLAHPSTVRWKVFTLPNELIRRRAGTLSARDQKSVRSAFRKIAL